MEEKQKSVFDTLNEYDISTMIKEKATKSVKLKYLPWSTAWKIIKTLYPDAQKSIIKDENGNLYHTDGKTCWVETSMTIGGETQYEELPVMNYANQSVPLGEITSMDVNKAKQRCYTKNAALFGLGLSLWVGEELSEEAKKKKKEKLVQDEKEHAILEEKRGLILNKAKELIQSGVDRDVVYNELKKISGKINPNLIESIEDCDNALNKLNEIYTDIINKEEEDNVK